MDGQNNPSIIMKVMAGLGLLGVGLGLYGSWIEPFWLEVNRVDLPLDGLDPNLDGLTILQISDIHLTNWMKKGYLDRVIIQANSLQPDVIALTGDYVYHNANWIGPDLKQFFGRLEARQAKVAILGNHDHWENPQLLRSLFAQTGVIDLSNHTHVVHHNGGKLILAGLDDPWEELDKVEEVAGLIPQGEKAVLLVHEPDFAGNFAETGKFWIQLSGHSHGGQVRIPLLGSPFLPDYAGTYSAGLYRLDGMWVYTNRGVGAVPYHFRINCRPEITLFRLRSVKE